MTRPARSKSPFASGYFHSMTMAASFLVFSLLSLSTVPMTTAADNDWTDCPAVCKCKWVSGRKAAECVKADLTAVPSLLSAEVQSLDLSENRFTALTADAFRAVRLVNLHKLFLKNCGIDRLDRDAFRGLEILIEMDLSGNRIKTLFPGTFRDNVRLRLLFLNNNPIHKFDDGLFTNLTFLQTIDASRCQLTHIGHKTFVNVPKLQHLKLEGNKLSFLKLAAVESLKLKSLVLQNNPWYCDCHLRPLMDWAVSRNLYAHPTTCQEPERLKGKFWVDVPPNEFACKPEIVAVSTHVFGSSGSNVTMSCKVIGDPTPETLWVLNSRVILNTTANPEVGYSNAHVTRWSNLTLSNLRPTDRGQYSCVAKNPAGVAERNVSLVVGGVGSGGDGGGVLGGAMSMDALPLIIGVILGLFLLLLAAALILFCCCCHRRLKGNRRLARGKKNGEVLSPNGEIVGNGNTEQEKSLLTVVNPVQKPPRRYESQPSCNNMEITELNRTLLDAGTLPHARGAEGPGAASLGSRGDESDDHLPDQSMDSLDTTATRSHDALDAESVRSDGRPYPDLLAFPPRASQDSPAGSSASTAPDHSALPTQPPIQRPHVSPSGLPPLPLHSPSSPINAHPSFSTLPYSRSQSPFSPPGSGPVAARHHQGYVTIPRRPRVPSWSAPSRTGDPLLKVEPIYDNLGPRTTADGSSVLSLNKSPVEATPPPLRPPPPASAPPASPAVHFNQSLPAHYTTIEEMDPVPSPAPTRASSRGISPTVPRGVPGDSSSRTGPSPVAKKFSPVALNGSRSSPEGSSLRRSANKASGVGSAGAEEGPRPAADSTPTTADGGTKKIVKVPPKPPPKPKKKAPGAGGVVGAPIGSNSGSDSTFSSDPLYEDEGEDGTEV